MISDGLAVYLLERGDSSKAMLRSVTRELLTVTVLRNVMFYFTPHILNKARNEHPRGPECLLSSRATLHCSVRTWRQL